MEGEQFLVLDLVTGKSEKIIIPKPDRAMQLFKAAMAILQNLCPENMHYQMCAGAEEFDDGICQRCWERYLLAVLNEKEK